MGNLNELKIEGRVVRDPELKHTPTALCTFSIAVDRSVKKGDQWENIVSFFDVNLWGDAAESAARSFKKGSPIHVEGRLEQQRWLDKASGQPRNKIIITAKQVAPAEFKKKRDDDIPF